MPGDEVLESKCRGIKVKGNYTFDGGNISMNVTGKKAKGISCDGTYTYKSGTTNVLPDQSEVLIANYADDEGKVLRPYEAKVYRY